MDFVIRLSLKIGCQN